MLCCKPVFFFSFENKITLVYFIILLSFPTQQINLRIFMQEREDKCMYDLWFVLYLW